MKYTPYRIRKKLEEIISPEEVDVTDVSKLKSGLSGKIWDKGGILKPKVRAKMIELGKEFYKFLGLEYPIRDIYFTGSLANYNWTSHSDIDVHVMFETPEEDELTSEYIFAKKEMWSNKHNITIYGFPVELFAKNTEEEHGSKAIYSLLKNAWIKKPSKKNVNIDAEAIKFKAAEIMNKIDDIEKMSNNESKFEAADKLKDKIKKMRAAALESGGEYSTENLVFKTLRNNGYLDKIGDIKTNSFDKQMSLDEDSMNIPVKKNILKVQKGIPGMTSDKIDVLKDFVNFTCAKLKIEEPVTVVIRHKKDEYISTTASYLPKENENHIRAGGRAIVDICRSIGHELTHNRQRELGMFKPGEEVQNIGGHIEDQANSIAGILIKDFTHNYGYDFIYERKESNKKLL
jgi:predicted nucleotidyltransferase